MVQNISEWYLSYMLSQYANIHVQLSMEPRFLGLGFIVCIYVLCPRQHFYSVMLGYFPVLVGWTITKQRIKCLAKGYNTVPLAGLELATFNPKNNLENTKSNILPIEHLCSSLGFDMVCV